MIPRLVTAFLVGFALAGCAGVIQERIFGCGGQYGRHCAAPKRSAIPMPAPPPSRFDGPYRGELHVVVVPLAQMAANCMGLAYACAFGGPGYCRIYLPKEASGAVLAALRRHEIAHCNGWPAHHPR